jgi:hypothetical protein
MVCWVSTRLLLILVLNYILYYHYHTHVTTATTATATTTNTSSTATLLGGLYNHIYVLPLHSFISFLTTIFLFHLWRPPSLLSDGYRGIFAGGKSRPWRDIDHSPRPVPRSGMSRSYTSSPSPLAPAWCNATAVFFVFYFKWQSVFCFILHLVKEVKQKYNRLFEGILCPFRFDPCTALRQGDIMVSGHREDFWYL